jgi:signal transduction histidine kinase
MSANANADAREADADVDPPNAGDYEDMLKTLDVAIAEAKRKVESGRVYDAANERVRIKWVRALAYTVNVRRQVTADRDLEELAEKVEALQEAQEADMEVSTR